MGSGSDGSPGRLLVVTEEPEVDRRVREALAACPSLKLEPVHAKCPWSAAEVVRQHPPAAILLHWSPAAARGGPVLFHLGRTQGIPAVVLLPREERSRGTDLLAGGAADWLDLDDLDPIRLERALRSALERGRLEAALRDCETRLARVMEAVPCGLILHDEMGRILGANQAATRIGIRRDDLAANAIVDLGLPIPPGHAAGAWREMKPGQQIRFSGTVRPPGREEFLAFHVWTCLDGGEGKLFLLSVDEHPESGLAKDLEALKGEYERLAEERGFILDMANDMIYRHDTRGVFNYVSPAIERISGYSPKDWERHYTSYMTDSPINREVVERTEEALSTGRQMPPYLVEIRHRDGHPVLLEVNERPYYEDGKLAGIIGVARDITEREKTLEERRRSEHKYRSLFLSSRDAIFLLDFDPESFLPGRFTDCNPMAVQTFGFSREELLDLTPIGVSPAEQPDARESGASAAEQIRRLAATGRAEFEWMCRRKSGEEFLTHIVLSRLGGKSLQATVRDVSERRRLEEERLRSQKLESLGVLAGGIAHDFNNLLAVMSTSLAILGAGPSRPAEEKEIVEDIAGAIAQARGVAGQLLAFSRGGAPTRETVPLADLLEDSTRLALRGTSVGCEMRLPGSLWPVLADRAQIGQVVCNLVLNAQQAMPEGGIVTVEARNVEDAAAVPGLDPEGRFVEFSIRDEGDGMTEDVLGRIFDPYFSTKATGRGLGLATAHQIVTRHGGIIRAASRPGLGSEFHVYLPAAVEPGAVEPVPEPLAAPRPAAPAPGRRLRLLVMDDEEGFLRAFAKMIALLGHEAATARDGNGAIEAFEEAHRAGTPFDAAILDLTVPGGMGGRKAAEMLLATRPGAILIATSGYSDDPVVADPKRYGFRAVLRKPFGVPEFEQVIRDAFTGGDEG